jgi:protein-S-isoprenylcysteine O-methyltransferase Ste14
VKGKVRGVLGVVLIYSGFAIRSSIKEEFMVRTFGSQYDDYRRTTGAIFPRVLN